MNLLDCFSPSLFGKADKTGLTFNGQSYTFGEINVASTITANALKDKFDIKKGDRISMYLENCPELIIFYLACLKLGVIVVPMNVLYKDRELSHLIADAEPKLIFVDQERFEVLKPLLGNFGSIEKVLCTTDIDDTLGWEELNKDQNTTEVDYSMVSGDDAALMIYTSGTTGTSKGALLTHHNLVSNIISLVHCWQWSADDKFILTLPLFHMHGLGNGVHGWLTSGCHTTLFKRFKADVILASIRDNNATLFFGVPTMYERFLEAFENGVEKPTSIRLLVSGSAPLSPETFAKIESVFGHRILERYGMSETAMITSNLYEGPNSRVQGTVGKALPGVSLRIAHPNNEVVGDDEIGEIQIIGPNVLKCYWRQEEKTRDAYTEDGFFKTGDLGKFDPNGNVIITGRAKELIISGGFNIYPQEIINCLVEHDGVKEAAVIGVPDQRRGELVKAYIVKETDTVTAEELMAYCSKHLASFKAPRAIEFIDTLPRNAMGKLQLKDLPNREKL
ncbi:MAG: hypothetical protein COA79_18445 [Planctomycetota bacterium]|nr:MAG: hypothetical protein COA79_18445 [Planctomycetota bacterium]